MINLLPKDKQKEIRAGRTNRILVSYSVSLLIILVLIVLIFLAVSLYLSAVKSRAEEDIKNSTAAASELSQEQAEITEFKNNLATAKTILDSRIDYSAVILQIAKLVPSGVVLDNLTLNEEQFGQPMTIEGHAKSESLAIKYKNILNDSQYFDNAYFESVIVDANDGSYKYGFSLTATIKPEILDNE